MSLLLEALKKAALEKQNRASNEAEQGRPAAEPEQAAKLGDTLEQGDAVEPVTPAAEPEVTLTSEVSLDIELDEAFLSEEPEVESDAPEQELVFEPEFEPQFEPEIELTEKLHDEEAEEDAEIELAADEVSQESAQESEAPVELVDEAALRQVGGEQLAAGDVQLVGRVVDPGVETTPDLEL